MRRPTGFTLIEVVIASAMVMILIAAFMQLLTSQARVATEEAHDTEAQTGLIRTVSTMLPYLEEAKLVASDPPPSRKIRFRVPLKDPDGKAWVLPDKVSDSYQFRLGVSEPGITIEDGYYELVFIPGYDDVTNTGRSDLLVTEATVLKSNGTYGVDLNQNGSLSDKFVIGSMHLRICDAAGLVVQDRQLGGQVAVPSPTGVVFVVNQTLLDVSLLTMDQRVKGEESRVRQTTTKIRLRGTGVLKPTP